MRYLRSITGKKVVVLTLLLSLASILLFPVFQEGTHDNSRKYTRWLRSHLGDVTSEAVEYAFTAAQEINAENLDAFIEAFVEAYAQASLDVEQTRITQVALFALLKNRYHLLDSAVTPHLLLKSALVRTLNSQDRSISSLWSAYERANAIKFGQQINTFISRLASHFPVTCAFSISPRGP